MSESKWLVNVEKSYLDNLDNEFIKAQFDSGKLIIGEPKMPETYTEQELAGIIGIWKDIHKKVSLRRTA